MLMNISPSNIFPNRLLGKRFHQHHQAVLAAVSINGLTYIFWLKLRIGDITTHSYQKGNIPYHL